ncbi:TetR/AcrR family transcriptional regulator [Nocardia altamirensis]|uniref:TetR/AcrR family transcriptional regulator n=1 Tax=Nocardia altamirensis TaxID=472158 RepID=UPI00083FDF6C|nr:hypothetical protein [Nocardia altamirensis]
MSRSGDARRSLVLDRAVHVASSTGLEGLSLGGLAEALQTSKSGIQTLFGTKQDLQLAIVEAAVGVFDRHVRQPAQSATDGLPRLRALLSGWFDYLEIFEGGCLFVAAASELDGRTGPVRDAIARAVENGYALLRREAELARRLGELPPDTDIEQLVFELHALLLQANHDRQLFGRGDAITRGCRAAERLLDRQ